MKEEPATIQQPEVEQEFPDNSGLQHQMHASQGLPFMKDPLKDSENYNSDRQLVSDRDQNRELGGFMGNGHDKLPDLAN